MEDWYDVWYPNLAPSVETLKLGKLVQTDRELAMFCKKFHAEMAVPEASRSLKAPVPLVAQISAGVRALAEEVDRATRD